MRNQQECLLALQKAYPILFHTENKQLAKISSLTANDLETSEVPYFTSFCIKSKERL
jgi:acyl-[acyl carrier protein]--UDP-N-acetylglucosamine O-acyltransferase